MEGGVGLTGGNAADERERHADDDDQQVSNGQVDDEYVGGRRLHPHVLVHHQHHRRVAHEAHHEDGRVRDAKQHSDFGRVPHPVLLPRPTVQSAVVPQRAAALVDVPAHAIMTILL